MPGEKALRIDKLLWYLRLAKSRTLAQGLIDAGRVRVNGARVMKAGQMVAVGALVVINAPAGLRAIRLTAIPTRRGPPDEARGRYEDLTPPSANTRDDEAHDVA
jgi:ribosome-associated heat shock protein Hsp15